MTDVRTVDSTTQSGLGFTSQDIDGLLSGYACTATTITYSFPTAAVDYGSGYGSGEPQNAYQTASAAQQATVRYALSLVSQYTGLTFTEVTESTTTHAMIRVGNSDTPTTSYAYYPGTSSASGDVWLGQGSGLNPALGSYDFMTIMHELGHSVGLKHGMTDDGTHGVLPTAHDSAEWSIMTYPSYIGAPSPFYYTEAAGSGPQTYMADDIAALQYIYGANFNTNAGDTTYTFSPTTGEMFIKGSARAHRRPTPSTGRSGTATASIPTTCPTIRPT
jgi:serralysin